MCKTNDKKFWSSKSGFAHKIPVSWLNYGDIKIRDTFVYKHILTSHPNIRGPSHWEGSCWKKKKISQVLVKISSKPLHVYEKFIIGGQFVFLFAKSNILEIERYWQLHNTDQWQAEVALIPSSPVICTGCLLSTGFIFFFLFAFRNWVVMTLQLEKTFKHLLP